MEQIISKNVKCKFSFILYSTNMQDEKDIKNKMTTSFSIYSNLFTVLNEVVFEKITTTAYKVYFYGICLHDLKVSAIEREIGKIARASHPSIRKVDGISVSAWSDKQLTIMSAPRVCKYCGKNLMVRSNLHGQFYMCEDFPRCKYTEEI